MFDPGGSTGRLRACPFLGGWRTLLCGEVFVWTLRWYPRLERFWYTEDLNVIFKSGQAIRYAVLLRLIAVSPESGWFEGAIRWHAAVEVVGING